MDNKEVLIWDLIWDGPVTVQSAVPYIHLARIGGIWYLDSTFQKSQKMGYGDPETIKAIALSLLITGYLEMIRTLSGRDDLAEVIERIKEYIRFVESQPEWTSKLREPNSATGNDLHKLEAISYLLEPEDDVQLTRATADHPHLWKIDRRGERIEP